MANFYNNALILKAESRVMADGEVKFPKAGCHICKGSLANLDGAIHFDQFFGYAECLVKKAGKFEMLGDRDRNFVNATTWQYYIQFPEMVPETGGENGVVNAGDTINDWIINMGAHKHRYDRVIEKAKEMPFHGLALLAHYRCLDEMVIPIYQIDLTRIGTPAEALEWLFQMKDKSWFNCRSFAGILEQMFGRNPA